ncbi:MAG: Sir2 silent information regulator family NAD-dependent deacetylase [Anaerostipes sp.]|nr:Sir2 silent information regulator family NAD-dependent deacetylase [Anaerostipes sp.]
MFSKIWTKKSMSSYSDNIERIKESIENTDAVVIGAGSGLSASAGFTYSGERFHKLFGDFAEKYSIPDMYAGGFYPFDTLEEYWAWWSRHIYYNRYIDAPKPIYKNLFKLIKDKDYFVLTTNVDHQFQRAGFDKHRLFYTQGDYGLFQCSEPCHQKTYENEAVVTQMLEQQKDMKIPTSLIPYCPICGKPMTVNLRCDSTFVEDKGWHRASEYYAQFLRRHENCKVLYLELGVGANTPGIIKYPFWKMTAQNDKAIYACINLGEAVAPQEIEKRSICIDGDIDKAILSLS